MKQMKKCSHPSVPNVWTNMRKILKVILSRQFADKLIHNLSIFHNFIIDEMGRETIF